MKVASGWNPKPPFCETNLKKHSGAKTWEFTRWRWMDTKRMFAACGHQMPAIPFSPALPCLNTRKELRKAYLSPISSLDGEYVLSVRARLVTIRSRTTTARYGRMIILLSPEVSGVTD